MCCLTQFVIVHGTCYCWRHSQHILQAFLELAKQQCVPSLHRHVFMPMTSPESLFKSQMKQETDFAGCWALWWNSWAATALVPRSSLFLKHLVAEAKWQFVSCWKQCPLLRCLTPLVACQLPQLFFFSPVIPRCGQLKCGKPIFP